MIAERVNGDHGPLMAALTAAGLPTDDLGEPDRTFFRFVDDDGVAGFGGYERHADVVLLRSLVMLPQARGRGLGRAATEWLLHQAGADDAHSAYLLTTDAAGFFEALGFTVIARETAPAAILATRQAADLCPASATMMMRAVKHS